MHSLCTSSLLSVQFLEPVGILSNHCGWAIGNHFSLSPLGKHINSEEKNVLPGVPAICCIECGGSDDLFLKKGCRRWRLVHRPAFPWRHQPFCILVAKWAGAGRIVASGREHLTIEPTHSNCFYQGNSEHCGSRGKLLQQLHHVGPSLEMRPQTWLKALWGTASSLWQEQKELLNLG